VKLSGTGDEEPQDHGSGVVDTQRHLENKLCPELLAPARQATVEVLVDGQIAVSGTIVDPDGIVLTKRSEVMTHRGILLGKLTGRLFDGEEVSAKVGVPLTVAVRRLYHH
jgi:hypothetical protein